MKAIKRIAAVVVGILLVLVILLLIVLSSPGLQTSLARRFLPEGMTLEKAHFGFRELTVQDIVFRQDEFHAQVEVISGNYSLLRTLLRRHLHLNEFSVAGLAIEVMEPEPEPEPVEPPVRPRPVEPPVTPPKPEPEPEPFRIPWEDFAAFDGLFREDIRWPPLSFGALSVHGAITLPGGFQHVEVRISGSDVGVDAHAELQLALDYVDRSEAAVVPRASIEQTLTVLLAPRQRIIGLQLDTIGHADIRQEEMTDHLTLAAHFKVSRRQDATGEDYHLNVILSPDEPSPEEMASFRTAYLYEQRELTGEWSIAVDTRAREALLEPILKEAWAVTRTSGSFHIRPIAESALLRGQAFIQADGLDLQQPEVETKVSFLLSSDFDVAADGQVVEVNAMEASLYVPMHTPFMIVRSEQPFGVDVMTGQPTFGDPDVPLVRLTLRGMPVDLVNAFLPDMEIAYGLLAGEFVLSGTDEDFRLDTSETLVMEEFHLNQNGNPVIEDVTIRLTPSGRYRADALFFDAGEVTVTHRGSWLVTMTLNGSARNIQAEPELEFDAYWDVNLPVLLAQPAAEPFRNLSEGRLVGTLNGAGTPSEITANMELDGTGLVLASDDRRIERFTVRSDIRTDDTPHIRAAGPIGVTAPDGSTDLEYELSLWPGDETTRIDLKSRGDTVRVDHFLTLAEAFQNPDFVQEETVTAAEKEKQEVAATRPAPGRTAEAEPSPAHEPDTEPIWAGILAEIDLTIRELILPGDVHLKELVTLASVAEEAVRLTAFEATIGESPARAQGALLFRSDRPERPYVLEADFSLTEFDVGAFLRDLDPDTKPALEAAINMSGEVMAEAPRVEVLGETLTGEFTVDATEGVLRALRRGAVRDAIDVSGAIGRAARLLDINRDVEAVGQLVSYFDAIEFEQFSLEARRNPDFSIDLNRLFLQSRELLLEGRGRVGYEKERKFHQQPIALTLNMGARPPLARLFDELNLLQEEPDDAGYRFLNQAIEIQGNVSEPDPRPMWVVILNAAARTAARRLLGDREEGEDEPRRELPRELPTDRLPRMPRL